MSAVDDYVRIAQAKALIDGKLARLVSLESHYEMWEGKPQIDVVVPGAWILALGADNAEEVARVLAQLYTDLYALIGQGPNRAETKKEPQE